MNLIKKMQNFIYDPEKENEDDQDGYAEGLYDGEETAQQQQPYNATRAFNDQQQPRQPQYQGGDTRQASNVSMTSGTSIEMKVIKPEKLDSVTQIADYLTSKNTVLLNLEGTNKETARRLLDFLNGVAYAVGGKLKKVANSTYVITPSNVSITGEQLNETQDHTEAF